MSMIEIEALARTYDRERDALSEALESIQDERRKVVRPKMRGLRTRVAATRTAFEALYAAVEKEPELFVKPRTVAIDGVKVGWKKAPGKIVIADEESTIAKIRKKLPERVPELIKTKHSIDRAAIKKVDAADLVRIGAALTAGEDEVIVTATRDDLEKLVEALLQDSED